MPGFGGGGGGGFSGGRGAFIGSSGGGGGGGGSSPFVPHWVLWLLVAIVLFIMVAVVILMFEDKIRTHFGWEKKVEPWFFSKDVIEQGEAMRRHRLSKIAPLASEIAALRAEISAMKAVPTPEDLDLATPQKN